MQIDLLDPRASDRFLRAYALLASEFATGAESAVDSLLPFIKQAAEISAGEQFDVRRISKYVEETYRVRAPIYMMDALKHRLLESGYLERPINAPDLLICKAGPQTVMPDLTAAKLSTAGLRAFEEALTTLGAEAGLAKPYASENWSEALIKFYAGWEDRKSATVARQLILDSKRLDDRVVSNFIASLDQRGSNYDVAKKLYYGVIVADFFTCITEVSSSQSLRNVSVVLDTTLLMRLLGTSGELLLDATKELVRDIQQLGGAACYFAHTYEELVESLEALAHQITNRLEMNRESAQALTAGETSLGKIQMCVREADIRLGQLGITQHEILYSSSNNVYQIDEEGFVRAIGGPHFEQHRVRWERDAKSLALILRLRKDKRTRKLGDSVAIFVTHNGALARTARDFLEYSAFDVPPILTTDQISVLAWLERGGGIDDRELSAKLAAACYEAMIPMEGWESQFWTKIEELKQSDEYRELLNSQVLTNSMRSTILDRTYGDPTLAKQMELGPILKELARKADIEKLASHQKSVDEGRKEALAGIEQRLSQSSDRVARYTANTFLLIIFVLILVLYLIPDIRMIFNPDAGGFAFYANGFFATLFSVIALLTLF